VPPTRRPPAPLQSARIVRRIAHATQPRREWARLRFEILPYGEPNTTGQGSLGHREQRDVQAGLCGTERREAKGRLEVL